MRHNSHDSRHFRFFRPKCTVSHQSVSNKMPQPAATRQHYQLQVPSRYMMDLTSQLQELIEQNNSCDFLTKIKCYRLYLEHVDGVTEAQIQTAIGDLFVYASGLICSLLRQKMFSVIEQLVLDPKLGYIELKAYIDFVLDLEDNTDTLQFLFKQVCEQLRPFAPIDYVEWLLRFKSVVCCKELLIEEIQIHKTVIESAKAIEDELVALSFKPVQEARAVAIQAKRKGQLTEEQMNSVQDTQSLFLTFLDEYSKAQTLLDWFSSNDHKDTAKSNPAPVLGTAGSGSCRGPLIGRTTSYCRALFKAASNHLSGSNLSRSPSPKAAGLRSSGHSSSSLR